MSGLQRVMEPRRLAMETTITTHFRWLKISNLLTVCLGDRGRRLRSYVYLASIPDSDRHSHFSSAGLNTCPENEEEMPPNWHQGRNSTILNSVQLLSFISWDSTVTRISFAYLDGNIFVNSLAMQIHNRGTWVWRILPVLQEADVGNLGDFAAESQTAELDQREEEMAAAPIIVVSNRLPFVLNRGKDGMLTRKAR